MSLSERTGIKEKVIEEICAIALEFDIIDLSTPLGTDFMNSIKEEGILIYEKT